MREPKVKSHNASDGGEPTDRVGMQPICAHTVVATVRRSARGKPFEVEHRRRRALIARHAEATR